MSKAEPLSLPESSVPPEAKQKTWVLLTDSDGTLFYGNMKTVISEVIKFLRKAPSTRSTIDELFTQLGDDLPEETQKLLQLWLEKQEQIPWAKPVGELLELQQTIASFFPLIQYQQDEKPSFTALDVFKAIWEKQGIVIILTFNTYAPHTLRYALMKQGLPKEKTQQIYIIYPGDTAILPEEGVFIAESPGDGDAINKNNFIQKAQSICSEEFKLTPCQYIFVDDQHAQAARLLKCSEMTIVTGNYAKGQHWGKIMDYIQGDIPFTETRTPEQRHDSQASDHSSPESRILDIVGDSGATPVLSLRSMNSSSLSSTPFMLTKKLPRKMSTLELPPMLQPTASLQSTSLRVNSSLAQDSLSPQPLVSPRHQAFDLGSPFFPASSSSSSSFFASSIDEKSGYETDYDVMPTRSILNKRLALSSSTETFTVDTRHTATLLEQKQTSQDHVDLARPGQLNLDLNSMSSSSLRGLDNPKTVRKTDEIPLTLPPSVEQTFEAAYAHANTLSQKIQVIVGAIKHFYPQTANTLESATVRFIRANPRQELHLWIQKLDTLFIDDKKDPEAQRALIDAAIACWTTLQPSTVRDITEKKDSPMPTDTAEENIHFLSSAGVSEIEKNSPATPSSPANHVAVKELEKWHQRQLVLDTPVDASSCCCLIL